MGSISVYSEIGKLKKVILHRPGREVENLTPDTLGRLLFDDIPYLKVACQEHDTFAGILKENGAEVFYVMELAAQALSDGEVKRAFVSEMLAESFVFSSALRQALTEYLLALDTREMVDRVAAGIRKNEIEYKGSHLSDMIKDDYEFYLDPMPNLYFTRDPGACIGNGVAVHSMTTRTRRREALFLKYIHAHHELFEHGATQLWYNPSLPFAIEGGDVLVLSDKVVAIGYSERTTAEAIETVARELFDKNTSFEKVMCFEIQKKRAYMHLDTVLTMIDYDKFSVHPDIEHTLNAYEITRGTNGGLNFRWLDAPLGKVLADALNIKGVELLRCGGGDAIISMREQWNDGSNTLAVAPGVVVTYDRNNVTNDLLEKKGIKVLAMPSSELSRGRGGPRCMSMTVAREAL